MDVRCLPTSVLEHILLECETPELLAAIQAHPVFQAAFVSVRSVWVAKQRPCQQLAELAELGDAIGVQRVLNCGSVLASSKDAALAKAAKHGHNQIVWLLLEAGASANAKLPGYSTALAAAWQGGHTAVMQLLLARGACFPTQAADLCIASCIWPQMFGTARHKHVAGFCISRQ